MGRKPIGDRKMTANERQQRHREKKRANRELAVTRNFIIWFERSLEKSTMAEESHLRYCASIYGPPTSGTSFSVPLAARRIAVILSELPPTNEKRQSPTKLSNVTDML